MVTILSRAPSAPSVHPYQDHSECAHQAVKWKSLMAPLSASKNSLPFPLYSLFIGILKAIKYDNSALSSRLNFPLIALNQSYFFLLCPFFFPYGVHMDSDALPHHGGNERTLVSTDTVTQINRYKESYVCVCVYEGEDRVAL